MEELVPIVLFLTIGLIIISFFYFVAKEKQLMIEKQTPVEVIEALKGKKPARQGFTFLKIGIILVFFGLGLGAGAMSRYTTGDWHSDTADILMATSIFVFTGAGFIVANLVGKKLEKKEDEEDRQRLNA